MRSIHYNVSDSAVGSWKADSVSIFCSRWGSPDSLGQFWRIAAPPDTVGVGVGGRSGGKDKSTVTGRHAEGVVARSDEHGGETGYGGWGAR